MYCTYIREGGRHLKETELLYEAYKPQIFASSQVRATFALYRRWLKAWLTQSVNLCFYPCASKIVAKHGHFISVGLKVLTFIHELVVRLYPNRGEFTPLALTEQ